MIKATVYITLKHGVLDPQGKAIHNALGHLGFDGVKDARQGKMIELVLDDPDTTSAKEQATKMCEKLLANTVIENYRIELNEVSDQTGNTV